MLIVMSTIFELICYQLGVRKDMIKYKAKRVCQVIMSFSSNMFGQKATQGFHFENRLTEAFS